MLDNILKGAKVLFYLGLTIAVVKCSFGFNDAVNRDVYVSGGDGNGHGTVCVGDMEMCKEHMKMKKKGKKMKMEIMIDKEADMDSMPEDKEKM